MTASVDFQLLVWLFPIAITIHNLEEAIWLPKWTLSAGRWHPPVAPFVFRFAVAVLTLLAYLAALLAWLGGQNSVGAYLVTGYALAMLLNVALPHLVATVATKRYVPGLATALVFNAPVTYALLQQALIEEYVAVKTVVWVGPLVVGAVLGSVPVLFAAGRWIASGRRKR